MKTTLLLISLAVALSGRCAETVNLRVSADRENAIYALGMENCVGMSHFVRGSVYERLNAWSRGE